MIALITSLLPLILQIVMYFVNQSALSLEAKKAFYEWVKLAGKDVSSVKLMQAADRQLQWFVDHPDWKESP